jgi:hypothetical protein
VPTAASTSAGVPLLPQGDILVPPSAAGEASGLSAPSASAGSNGDAPSVSSRTRTVFGVEYTDDKPDRFLISLIDFKNVVRTIMNGGQYSDYMNAQPVGQAVDAKAFRGIEVLMLQPVNDLLYEDALPTVWNRLRERSRYGATELIVAYDGAYTERTSANKGGKIRWAQSRALELTHFS